MRKAFLALMVPAAGLTMFVAAPAQAAPAANHGQCVSQSPQPSGPGGRSDVARDKSACSTPAPAPLDCDENGEAVVNSETNEVTVTGTGAGTPGSSLECDVTIGVTEGQTITFDYTMAEGTDPCGGGVPRIYVTIDGTNYNTIDGDPECADATGSTITYTIPVTGTVSHVGLVYDRGDTGSVTYSNVTIGDVALDF